ncbi:site-specific recombinase XerD [Pseudomonas nitroreducens]|nr:site-specific recombinase XerD [Pseudomonas nitroreducens]
MLDDILKDAECAAPMQITVTQRDNVTEKQEEVRLLFQNCISDLPWTAKTVSKSFTQHLKRSGVRHCGANQCRHTFASQALHSRRDGLLPEELRQEEPESGWL